MARIYSIYDGIGMNPQEFLELKDPSKWDYSGGILEEEASFSNRNERPMPGWFSYWDSLEQIRGKVPFGRKLEEGYRLLTSAYND